MIAIVAPGQDVHARRVGQELDRLGVRWLMVDLQQLPPVSYRLSNGSRSIGLQDLAHRAEEPLVAWQRRPNPPRPETLEADAQQFAYAEWRQLVFSMFDDAVQVSSLSAQTDATKPRQLARAQRAGLPIPATLITNDPRQALAFIAQNQGQVVHKAMSAPRGRFLKTEMWCESDAGALQNCLPLAPTIFQERIPGDDVRVTVVGEQMFAMRAANQTRRDVDGRQDLDAEWTTVDVPSSTADALRQAMRELGLCFGTVDFIAGESGWTFLEVNPQGQFLFQEILTGQPLAATVAAYLAGLAA